MDARGKEEVTRFIPGAGWVHPDVLRAQARPVIGHREPLSADIHTQCESGLKAIFQTQNRVLISTSAASGLLEGGIRSLVGQRSLHLVCGANSRRWFDMARACGKEAQLLEVPPGEGISPELLEEHLQSDAAYDAVFITHHESSTGVANPLVDLCRVARAHEGLLICVDAVSSLGGVPVPVDDLGIDYCVTASHYALSLPPGLAFASVSERALARAADVPNRGWYFDLLNLEAHSREGFYPATPAITLMYALAHQLVRIFEEGLETRYDRHARMAAKVQAWGAEHLALFAHDSYRSLTMTTLVNTRGLDFGLLSTFLAGRGLAIAAGHETVPGQTLRIAHMGDIPALKLESLLEALTEFVSR